MQEERERERACHPPDFQEMMKEMSDEGKEGYTIGYSFHMSYIGKSPDPWLRSKRNQGEEGCEFFILSMT